MSKKNQKMGKSSAVQTIVSELCDAADNINEVMTEVCNRFTTTETVQLSSAVGKTAEVSVGIPSKGTGEVIVSLGRGLQHYPAQTAQNGRTFKRGETVRIKSVGQNCVYVTALE